MSVRIRYSKTTNGIYESVKKFQHETNGALYKIILNTFDHQWQVVNDITDSPEATGHQLNLTKMKVEAKNALSQLGISFKEEKRIQK